MSRFFREEQKTHPTSSNVWRSNTNKRRSQWTSKQVKVSERTEADVKDILLKYKCPKCSRTFPKMLRMNIRITRWCTGDPEERSRQRSLAVKEVQKNDSVKGRWPSRKYRRTIASKVAGRQGSTEERSRQRSLAVKEVQKNDCVKGLWPSRKYRRTIASKTRWFTVAIYSLARLLDSDWLTVLHDDLVTKLPFELTRTCAARGRVAHREERVPHPDYRLSIYLRQKWVDPRLTFGRVGDTDHVLVSAKDIEHIWKPDLFFPNEKSASMHQVTIPNKLMRIYHNGTVLYTTRSDGYDKKHLLLDWDEDYGGVVHKEDMDLPQFRLSSKKTVKTLVIYPTGTYSRLTASFDLERLFGFFLLQTYLPTILIVILAWVSFWINMDSTPARVGLGITTVLTMAAQLSGSKASIPKVHYSKAIDIWMAVCMMFVFVSLIEYAFVNALSQTHVKKDEKEKDNKTDDIVKETFVGPYVFEPQLKSTPMCSFSTGRETAIFIERVFRICFPVAFVIFNIVYWSVYLSPYEY
ncbi:Glycine receptor subunit alpha-4 [Lamellibrachia satsuma]|nr:Glycine receptor subunit alpha-4 [Lamellibrachia satsuma]